MELNARADEHDRLCPVPRLEETERLPSLSIALVSHDGVRPPSLTPLRLRVTGDADAVRSTDDVVVCWGQRPADDVRRLHRTLGRDLPAVLVAARGFDPEDVVAAFDHGAISYLVLSQTPEIYLVDAVINTARGESCLSPIVATTLLRHVYPSTLGSAGEPVPPGDLTPRERQIMELLVTGHTITEIADRLALTGKTVRNRLSNIYAKLQVRGQSEAILLWLGGPSRRRQSVRMPTGAPARTGLAH